LLTATLERGGQASLGFQSAAPASESRWLRDKLAAELGAEFMAEVDFVFHEVPVRESAHRSRIEEDLLPGLASRYREHGITLRWNDGLVDWMLRQADGDATLRDWERIVDERLSPLLLSYIPAAIETQVEIDIEVDGKGLRVSCPELDLLRRH
jgi:ATP-dependent Clp protease ATP-binding subunit ClpA